MILFKISFYKYLCFETTKILLYSQIDRQDLWTGNILKISLNFGFFKHTKVEYGRQTLCLSV